MRTFVVPVVLFLIGAGCITAFQLIGGDVGADGIVREPFFLLGIGYGLIALSLVAAAIITALKMFGSSGPEH